MDILSIRERLNDLPFVHGKRQVLIGRISQTGSFEWEAEEESDERIPDDNASADESSSAAAGTRELLQQLEEQLQRNGLSLLRGGEDGSSLYAVQVWRTEPRQDLSWMRDAINWTARVSTIGIGMVVPALVGRWLDHRFGTHYLGLLGALLGVVLGVWQLLQLTRGSGSSAA